MGLEVKFGQNGQVYQDLDENFAFNFHSHKEIYL